MNENTSLLVALVASAAAVSSGAMAMCGNGAGSVFLSFFFLYHVSVYAMGALDFVWRFFVLRERPDLLVSYGGRAGRSGAFAVVTGASSGQGREW